MRKQKGRWCLSLLLTAILLLALSGCSAPTEPSADPSDNTTSVEIESPSAESDDSSKTETKTTTDITLTFGDTVVWATMDDSETTKAFLERLPFTISMSRYGEREYYAAIPELPENGEEIPDFENGDITYYTAGKSLAIFFGNEGNSSQSDLIRMGRISSDLTVFQSMEDTLDITISLAGNKGGEQMTETNFSVFSNVELIGVDLDSFNESELCVLYQQARYCQAMTEADTQTMREIVAEDKVFTHMSGKQQTREEYFYDIENESLTYFTIGIEKPVVEVNGTRASVTYTSILNADAYGAKGTYRMNGTHWFESRDGQWVAINTPEQ